MHGRACRREALVRVAQVLVALGSSFALASCGGASHTSTPSGSQTTAASASATSSTTTRSQAPVKHRHRHRKAASAAGTTSTGSVHNAPPPAPAGTPPAPAGLRPATGYGTYELCSAQCSGAIPASLRRSLHLPQLTSGGGCPVSTGGGPVKPLGPAALAVTPFIGSAWNGARVTWVAAKGYAGPVLIRGRQLGGSGTVGFGEGRTPYDELQLLAAGTGAPSVSGERRVWLTFTRVRRPGCFAYQVDGTSFSSVIVIRAH